MISILVFGMLVFGGCAGSADKEISNTAGEKKITADSLASYHDLDINGDTTYLTRQRHTYFVDSLDKMKAKADEPSGKYEMSFDGDNISFSGQGGSDFWSVPMARLLAASFSTSNGYETPESLGFEKLPDLVRIQGILHNVYAADKGDLKLYSRSGDSRIVRLEVESSGRKYSAFCYNQYYEPAVGKVVVHNIDIYRGAAGSIDAKLIYSVEYTGF
jgi:hypothetical protein